MVRGGNTSPSSAFLAFCGPNACQSDQAGTQAQAINSCAGLSIRYTLWSTTTTYVGSVAAILGSLSTHRSCTISSLQASLMNGSHWEIPHESTLKEKSCRSESSLGLRGMLCCSPPVVAERQEGRLAKRSSSHFVPRRGSAIGEQTIPTDGISSQSRRDCQPLDFRTLAERLRGEERIEGCSYTATTQAIFSTL